MRPSLARLIGDSPYARAISSLRSVAARAASSGEVNIASNGVRAEDSNISRPRPTSPIMVDSVGVRSTSTGSTALWLADFM